jgi:hypothetical protein
MLIKVVMRKSYTFYQCTNGAAGSAMKVGCYCFHRSTAVLQGVVRGVAFFDKEHFITKKGLSIITGICRTRMHTTLIIQSANSKIKGSTHEVHMKLCRILRRRRPSPEIMLPHMLYNKMSCRVLQSCSHLHK